MTKRIGKIHKTYALIGGGTGFVGGICLTAAVGSPLPILRLLGAAAGYALACSTGGPYGEAPLWRGLTFLVAEVTFSFAWYSLSFGSFLLFPAWICLLLSVAAGVTCLLSWYALYRLPAYVCGGVTLWLLCMAICHVVVILHN